MAVSMIGGVLVVGVFVIRVLLFGIYFPALIFGNSHMNHDQNFSYKIWKPCDKDPIYSLYNPFTRSF